MPDKPESDNRPDTIEAQPEQEHVIVPVCYLCDRPAVGSKCARCNKWYCEKDTSLLDGRYCNECMVEVTITEEKYTKITEEYDEERDVLRTEKHSCKDIIFKGIDWMFACRRINEMSDAELRPELEYHRALIAILENELVNRSVKNYKMKVQAGIEKKAARLQTKIETKSKKVVKSNQPFDPLKFAQALLAMGITSLGSEKKQ